MSESGVIPPSQERVRVQYAGSVQDMTGRTLHVSVSGPAVIIGAHALNREQAETFAQLFVRAIWLAAQE